MTLFLVVFSLTLGAIFAQEKAAAKKEAGKATSTTTKTPAKPPDITAKQSSEMAKLTKMFVGTWTVDEKFEAVPEMGPEAQAGTGKGSEVVKAGPAGNSLIGDFKSHSTMGAFSGHGVIWWDAKAGVYHSLWCDSESPDGCDAGATGKWEGNNLVFTSNVEMMGSKGKIMMKMRQVYTDVKAASFTFYIEASINSGAMKRMMTVNYKK
jgi:hypothetical protein